MRRRLCPNRNPLRTNCPQMDNKGSSGPMLDKVEGLVTRIGRGGSNPLGRTEKALLMRCFYFLTARPLRPELVGVITTVITKKSDSRQPTFCAARFPRVVRRSERALVSKTRSRGFVSSLPRVERSLKNTLSAARAGIRLAPHTMCSGRTSARVEEKEESHERDCSSREHQSGGEAEYEHREHSHQDQRKAHAVRGTRCPW
jgi:hypothetical protein